MGWRSRYIHHPNPKAPVNPRVDRAPFRVATNPETWFHRIVAWLEGDTARMDNPVYYSMEESEMGMLKNASALLAGLHVIEQVTDAVAEKHAKGEHFTIGDLANVIAKEAPAAVREAGIEDHPWKPVPPRRGGRKPAGGEDAATK